MAINSIGNGPTIEEIIGRTSTKTKEQNPGELGKDQFIQLLITQLRYQDPMSPTEDKEFIGQMAQFSALEQMQSLNENFQAVKGTSLLGKEVKGILTDPTTKQQTVVEGLVTGVKIGKGSVSAVVNGKSIPVESVTEIFEPTVKNL
jgi:flagellar basal-body rod modification protein FlgD